MFKVFCLKEIKTEMIKTFHSNHKNLAIKFLETVTSIYYIAQYFNPLPQETTGNCQTRQLHPFYSFPMPKKTNKNSTRAMCGRKVPILHDVSVMKFNSGDVVFVYLSEQRPLAAQRPSASIPTKWNIWMPGRPVVRCKMNFKKGRQ